MSRRNEFWESPFCGVIVFLCVTLLSSKIHAKADTWTAALCEAVVAYLDLRKGDNGG